jgi:tripartite-type tricarboxylate transporter receptor subunit TctC
MMRRVVTAILALSLLALGFATAQSQDYPSRPVRIVVGFGPGSVADLVARVLGARMSQLLGQQFVVENRAGAGSSLGAEFVARANNDGHTLFMSTVANSINPALHKLSFDFGKDLAPIILVGEAPQMLVAHPSLGVGSIKELIELARTKTDQVQYATSGAGTLGHLSGELLAISAGIKLVPVPYPGSAQGMTDVLAGRVPLLFGPASTVWPSVQAGKLKALAVTQNQRAAMAPQVPTLAESGVVGSNAGIWMGLLAPAGTPKSIVDKLAVAANQALKSNDVLGPLRAQGVEPRGGSPEDFARFIAGELAKWSRVVAAAGLKK